MKLIMVISEKIYFHLKMKGFFIISYKVNQVLTCSKFQLGKKE